MQRLPVHISPDLFCPGIGHGRNDGDALVTPIVQSTTFSRSHIGSNPPHQYSRVSNPTVDVLEDALASLEPAAGAACFSTGLAAETALFLSVAKAGDHIVCARCVYGGTTRLLERVLGELGISTTFVDATDLAAVHKAVVPGTRLLFIETPSNPTLELTDIQACARIAHEAGALLAVDNTFLTPVLQQPIALGADICVYSTTKFIEGHSAALGGALVVRDQALLDRIRFIRKCTGAIQTPFNSWLTINGLKTLPLRIRAQSQSALAIAKWLQERPEVTKVHYPALIGGAQLEIARRQHLEGDGAVVTFEIQGGIRGGRTFVESLSTCTLAEHVGCVGTLITHPATMTHADVAPPVRRLVGISDGLLRLSVGLEPVWGILEDLERGFAACVQTSLETEIVG